EILAVLEKCAESAFGGGSRRLATKWVHFVATTDAGPRSSHPTVGSVRAEDFSVPEVKAIVAPAATPKAAPWDVGGEAAECMLALR
ncbi:unnamed protein product, partial [Prorocentrum cordatum]